MIDRQLCGWRIRTEIDLPELTAWSGDDREPDIHIVVGTTGSDALPDNVPRLPVTVHDDGTSEFVLFDLARYVVDPEARRVTISSRGAPDSPDVRLFLFGTVFGILCFRRGLLPLHAASINIDGKAIAFAGKSGVGKSTLANAFIRLGYPALADDVTVVDLKRPGGPVVLPGLPRLKLWRDALEAAEQSTEGLQRVRETLEKYHMPMAGDYQESPLPLGAVYLMTRVPDERQVRLEQARGINALTRLENDIYRHGIGRQLLGRKRIVDLGMTMLRDVPVYELDNLEHLDGVEGLATRLAARHRTD
ncbi:MAG: hypothetical protein VYB54_11830 [Pseudomonadota bacterium]|nr:hypothetical protein [Pseudomonadota bacterium]